MKGVHCAFQGRIGRDAEIKTVKATGRPFVTLSVIEGDGDEAQWINVLAWSDSVADIAGALVQGVEVYIEGKLKLRSWQGPDGAAHHSLSVSASTVQPMALIGRSKPKAPRAVSAKAASKKAKIDPYAPSRFADGTDADVGDPLPI
jgi:single-stranded DNA-binding protein